MAGENKVVFRRVRGRIVPIRSKGKTGKRKSSNALRATAGAATLGLAVAAPTALAGEGFRRSASKLFKRRGSTVTAAAGFGAGTGLGQLAVRKTNTLTMRASRLASIGRRAKQAGKFLAVGSAATLGLTAVAHGIRKLREK